MNPIPYSLANLPITAANFPCLKHAFTRAKVSGKTLTCPISGLVLTSTTSNIPLVGNDSFGGTTSLSLTASAAWNAPGTKDALWLCTGSFAGNAAQPFIFGTEGVAGVAVSAGGLASITKSSGNSVAFGATTAVAPNSYVAVSLAGTVGKAYVGNDTTNLVQTGTNTGTPSNIVLASGGTLPSESVTSISGIYMFVFNAGLPADLTVGMAWMGKNPGKVYPGWQGLA